MKRTLIHAAVFLGSAAIGLLLAALIVPSFHIHLAGFFVAIIVFALIQAVVEWLVRRLTARGAPAIAGIAGLISTFIALLLASLFTDGLAFEGIVAWVFATIIVWIVTGLCTWLAGRFLLRERSRAA